MYSEKVVQSWVKITQARRVSAKFEFRCEFEALFCQQVDDWMLLKITEKIIQKNVFEQKKKKPG